MRLSMLFALVFAGCCAGFALAEDAAFSLAEPRSLLVAPAAPRADSLVEATIEPTKHEIRFADVTSTEHWEQNFQLAARLPVAEAFSLRQEFRTGLQSDTVLGQELASTYRDALAMLEKTAAELRASEALRIAASIQQQWIANNSVPFAEIVTYGAEAKFTPVKATTIKLQLELAQREEFVASQSAQETCRLALEQELIEKRLSVATGGSLAHSDEAVSADRESVTRRFDGSLKWTPAEPTTLTLGGELSTRDAVALVESGKAYAAKLQQKLSAWAKLELQAGYELRTRSPLDDAQAAGSAWNLGANSDFALHEDWNAGLGVRYRLHDDAPVATPADELSLTLSVKGRF